VPEPSVPLSVSVSAACVVTAVHLDDEPRCRRDEVNNIPSPERHLPPKLHAELATAQRFQKPRLRLGRRAPIVPSVLPKFDLTTMSLELSFR